jgi:hypothetical protein
MQQHAGSENAESLTDASELDLHILLDLHNIVIVGHVHNCAGKCCDIGMVVVSATSTKSACRMVPQGGGVIGQLTDAVK